MDIFLSCMYGFENVCACQTQVSSRPLDVQTPDILYLKVYHPRLVPIPTHAQNASLSAVINAEYKHRLVRQLSKTAHQFLKSLYICTESTSVLLSLFIFCIPHVSLSYRVKGYVSATFSQFCVGSILALPPGG